MPPYFSFMWIPLWQLASRSGLSKLLFWRLLPSLVLKPLYLANRWAARCCLAPRRRRLLSLRFFTASFRLLCYHSLVIIVGLARSLSRTFCVAAFSATFLISSCSRTLTAVSLSMGIHVALARARSSACLHLRDGVGLVDWAGESRIGGCAFGRACCALAQSDACSLID